MTADTRFDKFLAYLEERSRLNQGEITHIQESLGSYEIDPHRQTAIKIMTSGLFAGERFKRKTGERECHYIRNFEQFIAKVAKAIDNHSDETQECLNSRSRKNPPPHEDNISPDLAERMDTYVNDFSPLEQEIRLIKGTRSNSLAKVRKMLEKLNEDVKERLSKEKFQAAKGKHWPKAKIPHHLIAKLIFIIKDHSHQITKVLLARVIVKMLHPFGLNLKENSIKTEIPSQPKIHC